MTYRVGIDVGSAHTTWAVVAGSSDGTVDSGTIESAVGVLPDGQLVAGSALAGATTVVRDFVPRLGDSAPVMVGTTPYGAEALTALLVATVVDTARRQHGSDPTAVVMIHDDGLDQYRAGQLTEAARLAGIAPSAIVLAARSDATAAGGTSVAAGGAKLGWARVPDPVAPAAAGGVAMGAAGGAAVAATGIGAAALIADSGAATASAAAPIAPAGPAGTPLAPTGPAGTPLQPAGPSGTPLQPAGPTGTPIQPAAGPGGTPLQPPAAGPGGTPLTPGAGPAGSPLPGATPPPTVPVTAPVTTGIGVPKPKIPTWVTIAAGGAAVVAVGVGIAVIASGDDENPTLGGSEVVVDATDANGDPVTIVSDGGGTDTTLGGGTGGEQFDLTPILGTWLQPCEPFFDGSGASQGSMTLESPGPNLLTWVIDGGDAASADCSGGFESAITVTYQLSVTNAGESAGVQAFVADQVGDPTCTSIEPAACGLALGTAQTPPSAIGVDANGQLVISYETVSGDALPTSWEVMVEGSTRA
ncbi:MAG: hypothetical protein HY828_03790 [Actinobacteria bacterium]|nr:hypothetical protein [Actinomycetota bacterium]